MREWPDERFGLLYLVGVMALLITALLASCSRTQYVPVESVRIDSVSIRDTIVEHELVPYRDSVVTADTASFLTNPYAYSRAKWVGGKLYHTLGIWPKVNVTIKVPYYIDRYRTVIRPKIVEVERSPTKWERLKLEAGGVAIGVVIASLGLIIVRYILRRFGKK